MRFAMLIVATLLPGALPAQEEPLHTTYSIVAYDSATGAVGVGVQSKAPWVSSGVPHARAGVGAVATQSYTRYAYGPELLELMAQGAAAPEALEIRVRADEGRDRRQVGVVDVHCRRAAFTGEGAFAWAGARGGSAGGACYQAQGNLLEGPHVVDSMAAAFERTPGPLVDRLMAALLAAETAGGDGRGKQSAALLIVRPGASPPGDRPYLRLQVDDAQAPLPELQRLVDVWKAYQVMGRANRWRRGDATDPDSALAAARHATELAPTLDVAWMLLGAIHLEAGREAEARDAFRRMLALNDETYRVIAEYPTLSSVREADLGAALRILDGLRGGRR